MPHDVFVSYAQTDKATAEKVCGILEANSISVWIAPRDVLPGMTWAASIVRAIKECRVMLLVFSADSNQSEQIPREVSLAEEKGIPVIPLRTQDVRPGGALEYYLPTTQWLDIFPGTIETHEDTLLRVVRAVLSQPSAVSRPVPAPESIQPGVHERPASHSTRRRSYWFAAAGVAALIVLLTIWRMTQQSDAPARPPIRVTPASPDACQPGFVWREATPRDHVCVTAQTRQEVAIDNRYAPTRVSQTDHRYGADTCKTGFVWREAVPNDHVCVTMQARSQAADDNKKAKSRRAAP